MGRLQKSLQVVEKISKVFFYVGVISLCILFLLIFFDVAGRFLLHVPIRGADIYSQYLMVCVGFLALGFGQLRGTHPKMEYFGEFIYKRQKPYVELFTTALVIAFFCLLTQQIAKQAYMDLTDNLLQSATTIPIPVWYQGLLAALGGAVMILVLITDFIQKILKLSVKNVGKPLVVNSEKQGA